jgi:hypothetical protein
MSLEDTITGLIGGFLISLLTFYVGMQIQRRAEQKRFLREHIRQFFPILRELAADLSYVVSIRLQDNPDTTSLATITEKISKGFECFITTYFKLRQSGLEPELESCDQNTANELKGLYTMWKIEGSTALVSNLERYHNKVIICRNLVEGYLKERRLRV